MSTATEAEKETPLPTPEERPSADVVLYDGHCNFCRAQVRQLVWWDCQEKLSFLSLHDPEVARRWPDLPRERLMQEMCIIDGKEKRYWGPEAFRYLTTRLRRLWWLAPVMWFPGSMWLWRPLYRWVARNRYRFAGKTMECDSGTCSLHR